MPTPVLVEVQVDPTSACQEALVDLGLVEPTPDPAVAEPDTPEPA